MPLPERLGRLRRVRPLGQGGFATVWLYRDGDLRSDVAVKALAENWAQRHDVRERFLEEARILRAADSDHVVRVHDIGESDGTPWFVMSYADRGSLDRWMSGVAWAPEHALPLLRQAATGLGVLHARGVVHRDVKPQNLLLQHRSSSPGGLAGDDVPTAELAGSRLMVADLGVAKALLQASGLTQVVGTPAYMAPEQADGLGVDERADVHALAAVAYQLLTGRLLRTGGISSLVGGPPPVPPSALARLPRAVDDVLLRGVHPRPQERWSSVADLVRALEHALDADAAPPGRPPVARGSTTVVPAPGPVASPVAVATPSSSVSPVLLVLLALVLSFAVAFGVVALLR